MYVVYIVDDEPLVLADMKKSIPWQEYNFIVANTSTNPAEAIEEITALKPDVVFTDVKMPYINGLELIAALRERDMDCEFVVVSAYENFTYARQLIHQNGFDYLIKPVEREQYNTLLTRLRAKLDKSRPHKNLPPTSSDELNRILLYLNRELSKKHSLNALSSMFNINSAQICNLFSKHMNTTFSAYLTGIRMEAAARLLCATKQPVKAIAVETGYEDYFYFCRVFRDYYSCTPSQYRSGK